MLDRAAPKGSLTSSAELWGAGAAARPGASPSARARPAKTARSCRWRGWPKPRLGVRGAEALADAVRDVWASIASGRALAYLAAHGVRDVGMAVVVQRMVEARRRASCSRKRPSARGHRDERIINVGLGLGAPVVDGVTTPDVLRVDAQGRVIESVIAHKSAHDRHRPRRARRNRRRRTPTRPRSAAPHRELAEIALRLEKLEGGAVGRRVRVRRRAHMDRPGAADHRPRLPDGGDEETVWSSVNVGEALPGVATPLTWSVAGAFSEAGFRSAFATLGCTRAAKRAPRRKRARPILPEPHPVHADRRASAMARSAHAGRARRRFGRRRTRRTGARTSRRRVLRALAHDSDAPIA